VKPPFVSKRYMANWQLYLFVFPALVYFLLFHYIPMYGVQIAFKNFIAFKGIWGSPWVGLAHLHRFVNSYYFWTLITNTLWINLYQLILFPIALLVALSLNELRNGSFKKWVQTITYAPHFISVIVMTGMIIAFLHPSTGIINKIILLFGGRPIAFMGEPGWFKSIYVLSGEWQNLGWGAIVYLAALSGIDPQLHDAARMDGATRIQRIRHINLPGILPTVMILLILNAGNLMSVGFEKLYLLQNPLNMESSDVIQTYVYRSGLLNAQYSFSAAISLFNSVISLILILIFNSIARKLSETSLW
jgi:putative aldouronate transport system permease protein